LHFVSILYYFVSYIESNLSRSQCSALMQCIPMLKEY
jgi:hypothetical protein